MNDIIEQIKSLVISNYNTFFETYPLEPLYEVQTRGGYLHSTRKVQNKYKKTTKHNKKFKNKTIKHKINSKKNISTHKN